MHHDEFVRFLENIIKELKKDCVIIEDFNIDFMTDLFYTTKWQKSNLGIK